MKLGWRQARAGNPALSAPNSAFVFVGRYNTAAVDASGLGRYDFTGQFGHITGMSSSLLGLYTHYAHENGPFSVFTSLLHLQLHFVPCCVNIKHSPFTFFPTPPSQSIYLPTSGTTSNVSEYTSGFLQGDSRFCESCTTSHPQT
jgi:hypothetical protein